MECIHGDLKLCLVEWWNVSKPRWRSTETAGLYSLMLSYRLPLSIDASCWLSSRLEAAAAPSAASRSGSPWSRGESGKAAAAWRSAYTLRSSWRTSASFWEEEEGTMSWQVCKTEQHYFVWLEETCLVFSGQLLLLVPHEGRAPLLLLDDVIFILDLFLDVLQP